MHLLSYLLIYLLTYIVTTEVPGGGGKPPTANAAICWCIHDSMEHVPLLTHWGDSIMSTLFPHVGDVGYRIFGFLSSSLSVLFRRCKWILVNAVVSSDNDSSQVIFRLLTVALNLIKMLVLTIDIFFRRLTQYVRAAFAMATWLSRWCIVCKRLSRLSCDHRKIVAEPF